MLIGPPGYDMEFEGAFHTSNAFVRQMAWAATSQSSSQATNPVTS